MLPRHPELLASGYKTPSPSRKSSRRHNYHSPSRRQANVPQSLLPPAHATETTPSSSSLAVGLSDDIHPRPRSNPCIAKAVNCSNSIRKYNDNLPVISHRKSVWRHHKMVDFGCGISVDRHQHAVSLVGHSRPRMTTKRQNQRRKAVDQYRDP